MGQKVNPKVIRIGTIYNWSSRWYDDKRYKETLLEDFKIRKSLMDRLRIAGISEIQIERSINSLKITAYVHFADNGRFTLDNRKINVHGIAAITAVVAHLHP